MPELEKTKNAKLLRYEIKFELKTSSKSPDQRYASIRKHFLKRFNVRKLDLSQLILASIDDNAFSAASVSKYLEELDLSNNALSRLDAHILEPLQQLQSLNLSHNNLKFSEHNFESQTYLKRLDLSYNRINYVTPFMLSGLNTLEKLNLRGNNLKDLKACQFDRLQLNSLARKYFPIEIDLRTNPVNCDCDLFFLNRHLGYKIVAECEQPNYYKNISFSQLKREDPSYRCDYEKMEAKCNSIHDNGGISTRDLALIILFASLFVLFVFITCCCYCKNSSQSSKLRKVNEQLKNSVENSKPKKIYANLAQLDGKKNVSDTQALIESH
jgi:Leucine-rich repeat (LRR) protein